MTICRLAYALFILLILPGHSALANTDSLEKAKHLYHIGEYRDSAKLARIIGTANAFSLAAKATLVEATFIAPDEDKLILFQQAIKDAEAALAREPGHIDAHLQIALALGSIADLKHPIIAYLKGYATEGKHHLDIAFSIAPENAWVNGLLGIWHLQIVNHASALLADNIYNAKINDGLYYCNKAKQMKGVDLQILYGCAVSLYDFNEKPYTKQAYNLLKLIVEKKPGDVTESYVIQQAEIKLNGKI